MRDFTEVVTQDVKNFVLGAYSEYDYKSLRSWYQDNDAPDEQEIKDYFYDLLDCSYVEHANLKTELLTAALQYVDWSEIKGVLHEDYEEEE